MVSVLALLTGGPYRVTASDTFAPPSVSPSPGIQGFHLLSEDEGWLLLDQQVYWTREGGRSWRSITPAHLASYAIEAVSFRDTLDGWLVLAAPGRANSFALARTVDGGQSWDIHPLALFGPGGVDANAAAFYPYRLDAQTGWLVVRRATSSNFSAGTLFKTDDGGNTWSRLNIPIAEPVYFPTRDLGWVAGGPAGDGLYRSRDGGKSWEPQSVLPPGRKPDAARFFLPRFSDDRNGILPVMLAEGQATRFQLYRTSDGGQSWIQESDVPLEPGTTPDTHVAPAIVTPRESVLLLPRRNQVLQTVDRTSKTLASSDPSISGIVELDMATLTTGWGKYQSGRCSSPGGGNGSRDCTANESLLRTTDGGATWQALALPVSTRPTSTASPTPPPPPSAGASPRAANMNPAPYTLVMAGQAFDICEVPTLSNLQEWWTNSPYRAVNLYIGGSARACSNAALTADYVSQISRQGWRFVPTWVGPQAACSGYKSVMSSDPAKAYDQGIAEADAALQVAANLKMADPLQSGTVIYYDLEAYDTANTTCRSAANSFVSGWSGRLQAKGNIAGVYGASCFSAPSDWANTAHVPDVLWIAYWLLPPQYRSDATVYGTPCVADTLWSNHQRIHQYAGGHDESWGSVTLIIDSSVIDGVVSNLFLNLPNHSYLPLIQR